MILGHARVERSGIEVHAWASFAGLSAVALGSQPPVACVDGARPVAGITIGAGNEALAELVRALEVYLGGAALVWNGDLDLRGLPEFSCRVFEATRAVPWGAVTTYGAIARSLGSPRAVRAVGHALHHNPCPIVVPCHRVLQGGGRLGGFACGPAMKKRLLDLEAGQRALEFPESP